MRRLIMRYRFLGPQKMIFSRFLPSRYFSLFFLLLLPFVVFYWMVPFIPNHILGNDYGKYSLSAQMNLMFSLKHGSFPLFVPGFAGGHSSSALTLGQFYHPKTHLASIIPGYWNGKALEINTLLHLLSLGLTHWILFIFLRQIGVNRVFSLLISFPVVYNLRMLDLFRYDASLENYTAYLLLCVAVSWYYFRPIKYWGPLSIIIATYLLICGGHPQMMYYGLLGAWFFTLIMPFYFHSLFPKLPMTRAHLSNYYLKVFVCLLIGALAASVYILPFYFEFIIKNSSRVGQPFHKAITSLNNASVASFLNSLMNPFHSNVHGSFGSSSIFILTVPIILLRLLRVRIPKIIFLIWSTLLLALSFFLAKSLPFYHFFWKYFPFASHFRVPARVTMILPYGLLLLLVWLVQQENVRLKFFQREFLIPPYSFLAIVCALFFVAYHFLPIDSHDRHTPALIKNIPKWSQLSVFLCGTISLGALAIYGLFRRPRPYIAIILMLATFFQVTLILRYGTWVKKKKEIRSMTFEEMTAEKRKKSQFIGKAGFGMSMKIVEKYSKLADEKNLNIKLARIYWQYKYALSNDDAYSFLIQNDMPHRLVVENLEHLPRQPVTLKPSEDVWGKVILKYSSYNKLVFDTVISAPGFFVLAYPYSKNWRAIIDGRYAPIYRANGFQQAVWMPCGEHVIEFRYWSPAVFWGMCISCVTVLGVILFFSMALRTKPIRFMFMLSGVCFVIYVFCAWYNGLYNSKNLGTRYRWELKTAISQVSLE